MIPVNTPDGQGVLIGTSVVYMGNDPVTYITCIVHVDDKDVFKTYSSDEVTPVVAQQSNIVTPR